jgi:hypothetical protein
MTSMMARKSVLYSIRSRVPSGPSLVTARSTETTCTARGAARYPDAKVIVPPRSSSVPSGTADTAPTQRDWHRQLIAERGRMHWQKASGYNDRALVEADISRYKRVIGDAAFSHGGTPGDGGGY